MTHDANSAASRLNPLFVPPRAGPTLDVISMTHRYKVMASDTAGQFSIWETIVPPGHGVPAHTHTREDEAFYVLTGEVLVDVEGEADPLRLAAGAFLFAPRHRRHGYRNVGSDIAHLLVIAIPGDNLDHMFTAFDALGMRGQGPSMQVIAGIAEQHGVLIHSFDG